MDRDRDTAGRPRSARPRDELGRPLPYGTPGVARAEETIVRSPDQTLAQAQRLVTSRQSAHFRALSDAGKIVPEAAADLTDAQHSVSTRFFEVQGRLRLEQTVVEERSVVQRDGLVVKTLWRDRGALGAQTSPLQ